MDFRKRATIGAIVIVIMWFVVRLPFYYTGRIGDDAILMKTDHMQFPCPLTAGEERALTRSWYWARRLPVAVPVTPPDYILKTGDRSIRIWRAARVACDEKEVLFNLPPGSCILLDDVIIRLETMLADRFGELMPWDEVKAYFAMYCRAEIIDLETGKSFRVQRRGGRYHADCQPLTRDDTRVMKEIYGEWSWERRAIIVVVGGRRIAASMAGMPHGAGLIKDNDFPGHFCVHFWGSKVHATGKVDPEHQRRVLEAAGKN
ncbi:MAG: hypothetical protein GX052_10025 [Syntrophomonadaceae bacterium]|jgi:hypothetical protein|nr:hypothetical protein [Syntrophomonadaceae bacterium]